MCIGVQLRWFLTCAWECSWGEILNLCCMGVYWGRFISLCWHGSAFRSDFSTWACMGVHWGEIYQPGLAWECIEVRFINLGLRESALRSDLSTWACMGVHWGQIYQPGLAWECIEVGFINLGLHVSAAAARGMRSHMMCLETTWPSEGTLLVLMLCCPQTQPVTKPRVFGAGCVWRRLAPQRERCWCWCFVLCFAAGPLPLPLQLRPEGLATQPAAGGLDKALWQPQEWRQWHQGPQVVLHHRLDCHLPEKGQFTHYFGFMFLC